MRDEWADRGLGCRGSASGGEQLVGRGGGGGEGQSGRASEGLPPQRPDRRSRSRRPPTAPPSGERATVSEGDYQAQRRSVSVSGASAHRLQALALTPRYKHELPRAAKYTCAGPPPRAAEVRAAPAFATPESAAERRLAAEPPGNFEPTKPFAV
jgi:hypothetical protein